MVVMVVQCSHKLYGTRLGVANGFFIAAICLSWNDMDRTVPMATSTATVLSLVYSTGRVRVRSELSLSSVKYIYVHRTGTCGKPA